MSQYSALFKTNVFYGRVYFKTSRIDPKDKSLIKSFDGYGREIKLRVRVWNNHTMIMDDVYFDRLVDIQDVSTDLFDTHYGSDKKRVQLLPDKDKPAKKKKTTSTTSEAFQAATSSSSSSTQKPSKKSTQEPAKKSTQQSAKFVSTSSFSAPNIADGVQDNSGIDKYIFTASLLDKSSGKDIIFSNKTLICCTDQRTWTNIKDKHDNILPLEPVTDATTIKYFPLLLQHWKSAGYIDAVVDNDCILRLNSLIVLQEINQFTKYLCTMLEKMPQFDGTCIRLSCNTNTTSDGFTHVTEMYYHKSRPANISFTFPTYTLYYTYATVQKCKVIYSILWWHFMKLGLAEQSKPRIINVNLLIVDQMIRNLHDLLQK